MSNAYFSILGRLFALGVALICVGCIEGRKEAADGGGVEDAPLVVPDALPDTSHGLEQGSVLDHQVSCVDNGVCGPKHYCERSMGCLGSGICVPRPEGCEALNAPVCGCDDMTYENECTANAAGVSVATEGECVGGVSTCYSSSECAPVQFCNLDYNCGASAGPGVCELKPSPLDCSGTATTGPVCGCDGADYASACEAHVLGVSVLADQECGA